MTEDETARAIDRIERKIDYLGSFVLFAGVAASAWFVGLELHDLGFSNIVAYLAGFTAFVILNWGIRREYHRYARRG